MGPGAAGRGGCHGRRIKSSHNCGVPDSSRQEGKEVARLLLLMLRFEWRLVSGGCCGYSSTVRGMVPGI